MCCKALWNLRWDCPLAVGATRASVPDPCAGVMVRIDVRVTTRVYADSCVALDKASMLFGDGALGAPSSGGSP